MTRIDADDELVTIRFARHEKLLGILRDVTIPRACVAAATVPRHPMREVRGWRVGLGLPGVIALGTWRRRGRKQLVSVRRGMPAIRLWLRDAAYDEAIISTPDAERLRETLHAPEQYAEH